MNRKQCQQDRCEDSHLPIGGQEPDQHGDHTHDAQGQNQHGLAPNSVAVVPGDHPADGAGDKTDREC